jgi:hypothetical protein
MPLLAYGVPAAKGDSMAPKRFVDVIPNDCAGARTGGSTHQQETMLTGTPAPVAHRQRRFFVGMSIAALLTVFVGFAPGYYLKSVTELAHYPTGVPVSPALAPLIHLHALVFSAWIVLFAVQATLVAGGRVDIHRRLGVAGALLAVVMTVLGFMTAVRGARDGWNPGGPYSDSLAFMVVGFGDMLVFVGFIAAGFYCRRQPETHKRLMLLGTLGGLMWPAITRMPYIAGRPILMFGLLASLVLASSVRDIVVRARLHPVSLWGGLLILATFPVRVTIGNSDAWHDFAAWLTR